MPVRTVSIIHDLFLSHFLKLTRPCVRGEGVGSEYAIAVYVRVRLFL